MLLRIGDFSKLSQATVKMLRHYDDIGLLKPAHIDPFTKYRYYTIEQLSRIHHIIALKELGISLEQIGIMLNHEPGKEQIRGMLALREAEIEQRMREEQARLAQVRFRLRMLEMEEDMPDLEVVIKKLEPVRCLYLRRICSGLPDIGVMGSEINHAIQRTGITFDANTYQTNIFYDTEYGDPHIEDFDLAIAVNVPESFKADVPLETLGTMTVGDLEPVEHAATYIQRGEFIVPEMQERLTMLRRWCVANNYQLGDEYRIVFYQGPMAGYSEENWVTEIQHVVQPID